MHLLQVTSLLSLMGIASTQAPLVVNTPIGPIANGASVQLTWNGGVPPYAVSIFDETLQTTVQTLPDALIGQEIWSVNVSPTNDLLVVSVTDSTGVTAFSGPIQVVAPVQFTSVVVAGPLGGME